MSGVANWLPALPTHWEMGQLRWLASIYSGGTPSRENMDYWTDGDIPWLASGVVNQWVVTEPTEYITETGLRESAARWVPENAVLMGLAGQGRTKGLVARAAIRATCNQSLCAIVPCKSLEERYLHYWLSINHENLRNLAGGDKRDGLNHQLVGSVMIPLPPLAEQLRIADFLDRETAKIDTLIEKQNALIERLRERRVVVTHRLALGQDAPHPDEELSNEWFLSPPRHWTIDKLGRHTRVVNGSTPRREEPAYWSEGNYPWLNSSYVNFDEVVSADQFVTETALVECHLPKLRPGTVLIGITGQGKTRGMAALLQMEATINQHIAAVVPDTRFWVARYLTHLMRAAYVELRFLSDEGGSTRGALTCADLHAFRVPRPPLEEQQAVADHLDRETAKIDSLIAKAERFVELARERRAALITAAVTGQLEVEGAA